MGQTTESEIVNVVKGIEFKSEIRINQLEEEEKGFVKKEDDINTKENEEEVKDQVEITQEKDEQNNNSVEDELEESIQDDFNEEDDENLIHASCTLKRDNTVSISSNVVNIAHNSDNKEEVTEESYPDNTKDITNQEELNREESEGEQDRRKNKLRTPPRPPRKAVSLDVAE